MARWATCTSVATQAEALVHPLALARFHRGEFATAVALMRSAAVEAEQLFPENHPSRVTISVDLALLELHGGDRARARQLAESGLAQRRSSGANDARLAEAELVLAVLDCLQAPTPANASLVGAMLQRIMSDPALAIAMAEDYRRAAALCKPVD